MGVEWSISKSRQCRQSVAQEVPRVYVPLFDLALCLHELWVVSLMSSMRGSRIDGVTYWQRR